MPDLRMSRQFSSFVVFLLLLLAQSTATGRTSNSLAWRVIWWNRKIDITILAAAPTVLTAILIMQDHISRRPQLHRWLRIGFLTRTLVWLGWYAGAQLTIVYVISWIHTALSDFNWGYLLVDPLITILLGFTIAGMFLWGRAAFCGWLCPFGALQELANEAARRFRIPQITIPTVLHGRLVIGKYVLFVVLCLPSRRWLRTFRQAAPFDWLKRHKECGNPCRFCERVCPVGAIQRNGRINMNECSFCLDCQVTYNDHHTCPPMIRRCKQLEGMR